jgi:hypothetical protein
MGLVRQVGYDIGIGQAGREGSQTPADDHDVAVVQQRVLDRQQIRRVVDGVGQQRRPGRHPGRVQAHEGQRAERGPGGDQPEAGDSRQVAGKSDQGCRVDVEQAGQGRQVQVGQVQPASVGRSCGRSIGRPSSASTFPVSVGVALTTAALAAGAVSPRVIALVVTAAPLISAAFLVNPRRDVLRCLAIPPFPFQQPVRRTERYQASG